MRSIRNSSVLASRTMPSTATFITVLSSAQHVATRSPDERVSWLMLSVPPIGRRAGPASTVSDGTVPLSSESRLDCFSVGLLWPELKVTRGSLPSLTPIRQALTLTPELLPAFAHPPAALWTHTIQNAGDHLCTRLDCGVSHEAHTNLPMTITSAVRDPFPSRRERFRFPHRS